MPFFCKSEKRVMYIPDREAIHKMPQGATKGPPYLIWAATWENWSSGFPTRSHTNKPVRLQRMARSSKFRIQEVEGLYYPCSENKDADQLRGYREGDLHLCFRICKNPVFSRDGSYILLPIDKNWWKIRGFSVAKEMYMYCNQVIHKLLKECHYYLKQSVWTIL